MCIQEPNIVELVMHDCRVGIGSVEISNIELFNRQRENHLCFTEKIPINILKERMSPFARN